jgi:ribosomal protein S18 acetylase RimI-like enzyme
MVSASADVALEQNLWSMWAQFGRAPGCTLHDDGGALWFETPIGTPPYNMVVRFQVDVNADSTVDAIFDRFRARSAPFIWFVHPTARPSDLRKRLERRGFAEVEPVTGMSMDLSRLPSLPASPPDVEVRSVTPGHDLARYTEFAAARWQVPEAARSQLQSIAHAFRIGAAGSPNRAWIAIRDGIAVAKVMTHDCNGAVGLYGMATRPAWRGLGLGRVVCLTALADARRRGYDLAVLHSTPMAVGLYRSVGFREISSFNIYAEP